MLLSDQDIRQAVRAAIEPLIDRIEDLTQQVEGLQAKLAPTTPPIVGQKEAAKQLGLSLRTLQRRQDQWIEGIHWWRDSQSKRPLYNLPLIRDGQRQGFQSKGHLMACQQWSKEQQRSTQKKG